MNKSDLRDMLTADIKRIDDIRGRWMNAIDRVCFSLNILSNSFDNLVDVVNRLVDDEPKHRNR